MYVPSTAFEAANEANSKVPLVVNVHGTSRSAEQCRDMLRDVADSKGAAVLAPLFPFGVVDPNDADNYKDLLYRDIRYDQVLLSMLEEVKLMWEGIIDTDKFFLIDFSGGGQYTLRFLYLHPNRLQAAGIGAPGTITSLNERACPVGVGNSGQLFGTEVDISKIKEVKLHMVVGELDTGIAGEGIRDVLGGQEGVASRVETIERLHRELKQLGIEAKLDIVPGVEHDAIGVLPAIKSFLSSVLPRINTTEFCR